MCKSGDHDMLHQCIQFSVYCHLLHYSYQSHYLFNSAHSRIVACVFNSIRRFNGTDQCSTIAAYVRLEQETVGLLNGVQQMCGKGLMPKVTPCMQRLSFDMMQCFEEAGLNAELFSPRGSRMEGAIIGDNREIARMFCRYCLITLTELRVPRRKSSSLKF